MNKSKFTLHIDATKVQATVAVL